MLPKNGHAAITDFTGIMLGSKVASRPSSRASGSKRIKLKTGKKKTKTPKGASVSSFVNIID